MGAAAERLEPGGSLAGPDAVDTCPPPPLPKVPPRLTREERLALENLALKAENLRLQQERLRQDFATSSRMLLDLQKESHEFQMALNTKYEVDLAASTVQSDGSIVPKSANGVSSLNSMPPAGR